FGPVVGAVAALLGRTPVFAALAGLAVVLAWWTLQLEPVPPERPSSEAAARALRNPVFVGGLALMSLPALLFGVVQTLAPLHLSAAGWGAAAVGAVFLTSAAFEGALSPLVGRFLDRRGMRLPVEVALALSVLFSVGLAVGLRPLAYVPLVVAACAAYGVL